MWRSGLLVIAAGCAAADGAVEPSRVARAPAGACLPASFVEPCGVVAWNLRTPRGVRTAIVRGPGEPALASHLLLAGNRFELCGELSGQIVDPECGALPVFQATRFRIAKPVQRLACDDLWDDPTCYGADGKPARLPPAPLGQDDVASDGRLACDAAGCRIVAAGP